LPNSDAFALARNFDIRINLTTDYDVLLDQLDRVILAIRDLLGRETTELLWVEDFAAATSLSASLLPVI